MNNSVTIELYRSFAYKYILSVSDWLFINIDYVFADAEPPIINILYGWPGIYGQLGLWLILFSWLYSSKIIIYSIHYPAIFDVLILSKVL